jgi:hypothetical protein
VRPGAADGRRHAPGAVMKRTRYIPPHPPPPQTRKNCAPLAAASSVCAFLCLAKLATAPPPRAPYLRKATPTRHPSHTPSCDCWWLCDIFTEAKGAPGVRAQRRMRRGANHALARPHTAA